MTTVRPSSPSSELESFLHCSFDPCLLFGPDGSLAAANSKAAGWLRRVRVADLRALAELPWADPVDQAAVSALCRTDSSHGDAGSAALRECRMVVGGSSFRVRCQGLGHGGVLLVIHDDTRLLAAEFELSRLRRLRMLGGLLDGLAHDLHNCFGTASGFAQLSLEQEGGVDDEGRRLLDNLRQSCDQGARWMRLLTELTGVSSTRPQESLCLEDIVDDACALSRKSLLEGRFVRRDGDLDQRVVGVPGEAVQLLVLVMTLLLREPTASGAMRFEAWRETHVGRDVVVLGVSAGSVVVDAAVRDMIHCEEQCYDGCATGRLLGDSVGVAECLLAHRLVGGDMRLVNVDGGDCFEIVYQRGRATKS